MPVPLPLECAGATSLHPSASVTLHPPPSVPREGPNPVTPFKPFCDSIISSLKSKATQPSTQLLSQALHDAPHRCGSGSMFQSHWTICSSQSVPNLRDTPLGFLSFQLCLVNSY